MQLSENYTNSGNLLFFLTSVFALIVDKKPRVQWN